MRQTTNSGLTEAQILALKGHYGITAAARSFNDYEQVFSFARSIEAEVRKEDESIIRLMTEAAQLGKNLALTGGAFSAAELQLLDEAIKAGRLRLLDSDLSRLTERGKEAWAGVDPQKLREGGAL